jgi:hypothetical protein
VGGERLGSVRQTDRVPPPPTSVRYEPDSLQYSRFYLPLPDRCRVLAALSSDLMTMIGDSTNKGPVLLPESTILGIVRICLVFQSALSLCLYHSLALPRLCS